MFDYDSAKISIHEAIVRIFTGSILILAVLVNTTVPPWLSLIAIYPVMSGLIQWDPLVGIFMLLRNKVLHYRYRKFKATYRKAYSV